MNAEFDLSLRLSEPLERILKSKARGIALHAEQFDQAVRELKMEEALAILRVLQSDLEITEQGLIQGVRFGDQEAFRRREITSRGEPDYSSQEAKETSEA